MKRILELSIFQLLSEYTQHKASVAELTDAINELTAYLVEISTVEQDYAVLLRYYSMGLNRLKLYRMQFGQKENTLMQFIDEAIGIINTEIYIIRLRIKYPEQFRTHFNTQPLSPLYLADKTNLIDIMEMVSGLFLSKDIVYQNGKPAYLVDLAKAFEWLFNIRIGDCYQKHEDVIKRKPGKLTGFLNGLVELIKRNMTRKGTDNQRLMIYL